MTFLKSLAGIMPMPSVRDLEASSYLETSGPYPEFEALNEKMPEVSKTETSTTSRTGWGFRLFARSPDTINDRRRELLSSRSSTASARSSADLESQASTDASTLLDEVDVSGPKPGSRFDARFISDLVIGLADGLTVPFALTAGLSAMGTTRIVILAGLAELMAGMISMGLGGYLGARSEEESYRQTLAETTNLVNTSATNIPETIQSVFAPYSLPTDLTDDLTFHLSKSPRLTEFLMHFHHNSPEPEASRAVYCALTIALGYFLGGFLPLLPYFFVGREEVMLALWWSLGVMGVSLFAFGYSKTCFVSGWRGTDKVWGGVMGGVQMMLVGGVAAGCAMGFVRLFNSFEGQ